MKYNHTQVIEMFAAIYKPKYYLELGLYDGSNFNAVIRYCEHGVGVDVNDVNINGTFHKITTDDFFAKLPQDRKFDMIFIDADHSVESVSKDLTNALKHLNKGGIIFLHDTDPVDDNLIHPGYCGDCHKLVELLERRSDINIVTIPVEEAGLSLITFKLDTRTQRRH
jgi:hypothetical protein